MNGILSPSTQLQPSLLPSTAIATETTTQSPSPPPSLTTVKHASRFTEHFDIVLPPAAFETFILGNDTGQQQKQQQQRSMSISASRPSVFAKPVRMHSSPAITTSASSSFMDENKQTEALTSTSDVNNSSSPAAAISPNPLPTISTKQQQQQQQQQQSIALLYKDYASSATNSLNRADMMIKRLSNWLVFLKLASGWLVEIQKMTASSAFKGLKKDHPERYDQINKKRKECQAIISNFKKECRDKIHALKINPALQMEELLLRANETRKRMAHLSKLCDQADDPKHPHLPELDPWLANLQVLRYLKRETTEENRLRELMVPIQQEMKELETRLIEAFDQVVAFCVEQETTATQYGSTLDQVLGQFLPQHTWSAFVAAQQKEWVDEDHIKKNYLQINYPNKQHTHVATVRKGVLGRRSGVLKHYHDKYFVLTHYGYLHQFKLEDKIKPEASIYVTSTTIVPEVNDDDDHLFDEQHMAEEMEASSSSSTTTAGHTFDIQQPKRKTYHFKTSTGSELVSWCRVLTNVANGSSVEKLIALRKQKQQQLATKTHHYQHHHHRNNNNSNQNDMNSNSSITSSFTGPPPPPQQPLPTSHQQHTDDDDDDDNDSQFHSIHSSEDNDNNNNNNHHHYYRSPPAPLPHHLAESDIKSLDIGHVKPSPSITSSVSSTGSSCDQQQQQQPLTLPPPSSSSGQIDNDEASSTYFTPPLSTSTAPRRRPAYQANLNLMVASSSSSSPVPHPPS